MAQIIFEALLNTEKLEEAIKQSNQTIGSWVKSIEKAGSTMDQVIEKTTKTTKEAVKEQQALIKSLEGDIKRIESLITSATPMAKNKGLIAELSRMKTDLATEQGKLNELQNTGIKQDAEEEVSKNKIIESLKKWGMGLLTITGAIKVFKAIIASSNVLTEEFGFAVDGAKGALQQFFQVFSAGAGQTGNPIANMIKGFKGSKELAQNIDLYNDSMRANQVLEAQEIETLKQKEAIFRNASNTAKQRETALNDWIAIRKEAAARELKIEQDLNTSLLNEIKNRPNLKGVTDQEIGGFVTMYAKNPQLMQKAEELSKIYSGMAEWDTADKIAKLRKEIEQLLPKGITFESLMSSIRLNSALSDKQINALAESYKRLATAQGGGATVEAESARWLGSIINKGEEADKKLNDLKTKIDTLKTSLETAGESERKGIADKIILLEKELKLQQDIVNAALLAATIRETPPSKITGFKIATFSTYRTPSTLAGTPTQDSGDYIPGTAMLSETGKANQRKKSEAEDKLAKEILEDELKLRKEIVGAAADLVMQLGKSIGLSQEEMQVLGGTLDAFTKLEVGDLPGAAISMLSGLMAMIPNEAEKFALQVEHINNLIAQQQRLIDQSDRKGGKSPAIKDQMDLLNQQKAAADKQVEIDKSALKDRQSGWMGTGISLGIGVGDAKKKLEEAKQAAIEAGNAIEELQQEFDDFMRGGVTENIIADTIAQGFRDGKTSVDDFGNYMNTVLLDAVMNIFKGNILDSPQMKDYLGYVTQVLSDNVLSQDDIDILNKKGKEFSDSMKPTWDALAGGLDLMGGASANTGLSGQIARSITEDTGQELSGLFRRFADEQRVVKDYSIMGVNHLVGIEANTMNTVLELQAANKSLVKAVNNLEKISGNTNSSYGTI